MSSVLPRAHSDPSRVPVERLAATQAVRGRATLG